MSGTDDLHRRDDHGGEPHIHLLVAADRNRELLADWLADRYVVETGNEEESTAPEVVDLCLVDETGFARNRQWIRELKERAHPVFQPVVLIAEDPPSERLDPPEWDDIDGLYVIDEIVPAPVEQSVLHRRLENLLERRMLSRDVSGELEQTRERFQALFDGTPDPVVVLSTDHTIRYVNDAFCEQFTMDCEHLVDASLYAAPDFAANTVERITDHVDSHLAGESQPTEDVAITTPEGGQQFVEINVSTIESNGNDDAVVIMRDVTDRRKKERALEETSEQLEVLNRILRHDVRNDIQILQLWSEQLANSLGEDHSDEIRRIYKTAKHIEELTDNSREFIQTIVGEGELETEPLRIDELLREEIQKARSVHGDTTFEATDEFPEATIEANEMLASVFRNLLNNAVQHTRGEAKVEIAADEVGETVIVTVADNGTGVPDEQKEEIFGKGEQGIESEGTGIGLYLVNKLVESYNGDVWVEDNEPAGAVFVVELPITDSQ